jgi:hypothetical protein
MTDEAHDQFTKDQCIRHGGDGVPAKKSGNDKGGKGGTGTHSECTDAVDGDKDKNKTWSTKPLETFTEEDDATILRMKQENSSWNQIAAALGKVSKSQVQARHKELMQKTGSGTAGAAKDDKQIDKKAKAEENKAKGLQRQAELNGKKGAQKETEAEKACWSRSWWSPC